MNRAEAVVMALEACVKIGRKPNSDWYGKDSEILFAFAQLVAANERQACAEIVKRNAESCGCNHGQGAEMTTSAQSVTMQQLAKLFKARNQANADLALSRKVGEPGRYADALEESRRLNSAYDAARKQYKHHQKSEHKSRLQKSY